MSIITTMIRALKCLCCKKRISRLSGTIKFFDRKKRFGFIIAGTQEYFFHAAATHPRDFKILRDGVAVTFDVVQGKKGPQADRIEIVRAPTEV